MNNCNYVHGIILAYVRAKGEINKFSKFPVVWLKMAIILPIGQWYAPPAVINDAWYCMVLYGIRGERIIQYSNIIRIL